MRRCLHPTLVLLYAAYGGERRENRRDSHPLTPVKGQNPLQPCWENLSQKKPLPERTLVPRVGARGISTPSPFLFRAAAGGQRGIPQ